MAESWSTVEEAAEYFRISRQTIYNMKSLGAFPPGTYMKVGRALRLNLRLLEEHFSSSREEKKDE